MSKTITSTITGFTGTVVLKQPLHLDDVFAIEDALDKSAIDEPSVFWTKTNEMLKRLDEEGKPIKVVWSSRQDSNFLTAILKCSERFTIDGMPEKPTLETFPMTPRGKAGEFIRLLWDELQKIYSGEIEIPNES